MQQACWICVEQKRARTPKGGSPQHLAGIGLAELGFGPDSLQPALFDAVGLEFAGSGRSTSARSLRDATSDRGVIFPLGYFLALAPLCPGSPPPIRPTRSSPPEVRLERPVPGPLPEPPPLLGVGAPLVPGDVVLYDSRAFLGYVHGPASSGTVGGGGRRKWVRSPLGESPDIRQDPASQSSVLEEHRPNRHLLM